MNKPKMELFGGKPQVPVDATLLISHNENTGDREAYVTVSTSGPPFGEVPSIRPFQMEDGDLYGCSLREILQYELDHGGERCLQTKESLDIQSEEAKFVAYILDEFAAKFHQKEINLARRSTIAASV